MRWTAALLLLFWTAAPLLLLLLRKLRHCCAFILPQLARIDRTGTGLRRSGNEK
jgi:hypothetical protein